MTAAFRVITVVCAALALSGCGRSAIYRYKLTLSLDTPDGVKTGFNVVEVNYFEVSIPARGVAHKISGQGIYIDLGPGRRPLIALLTSARRQDQAAKDIRWDEDVPTRIFVRQCLGLGANYDRIDAATAINGCTTPFEISPSDLPDLVTFDDVNDPNSVRMVEPDHLNASLGPGVSWLSMTLEATDEPLSKGIDKKLPWLNDDHVIIQISGTKDFHGLPIVVNPWHFTRRD
jgi:hypothetical protein